MKRPFPAYEGSEPFIFVCYAHEDADAVYPELAALRAEGFNLWYDEGISAGTNWRAQIATSLVEAERVLFYISRASLVSQHCNREINLALDEDKEIVPVYLEPVDLTPDLRVGLTRVQALTRTDHDYAERLTRALGRSPDAVGEPSWRVRHGRKAHRFKRFIAYGLSAAALLVAIGLLVSWYLSIPQRPDFSSLTIAVQPFTSLDDRPQLKRYAAIVTDDLNAALSQARISLVAFDPAARNASDYVIAGRIRSAPGTLLISIELTRAADGDVLWTTTLTSAVDESARFSQARFVSIMSETLAGLDTFRAFWGIPEPAADAFFAGVREYTEAQLRAGGDWGLIVKAFERTIAQAPDFPGGYYFLALVYGSRMEYTLTAAEARPQAYLRIRQSLDRMPEGTYPHALINLHLDLDYASAALQLDRAEEHDVIVTLGDVEGQRCALSFVQGDLERAIGHCATAMAAHSTVSRANILRFMTWSLMAAERYADARVTVAELLGVSAQAPPLDLALKAFVEALNGDTAAASTSLDTAWARFGSQDPGLFVPAFALLNRANEAREALASAERAPPPGSIKAFGFIALGHYFLGDVDATFHWAERAIENRELFFIGWLRTWPLLDEIRDDPRYQTLMTRLAAIEAEGTQIDAANIGPIGNS